MLMICCGRGAESVPHVPRSRARLRRCHYVSSPIFDAGFGSTQVCRPRYYTLPVSSVMALVIPPPNRSRASSTCVRPALSINTLGRRRSSSLVLPVQQPADIAPGDPISLVHSHPSPSSVTTSQPSMLSLITAKCLEFLHVPKLHPSDYSTPSSPHSVSEADLVLPLSASSQSTFGDILNEKDASSHRWRPFHPAVSNVFSSISCSQLTSLSGACTNPISHASLPPVYFFCVFVTLFPSHLSHVATNTCRTR